MELLVEDPGLILDLRDLTDTAWLQAQWDKETPVAVALIILSQILSPEAG